MLKEKIINGDISNHVQDFFVVKIRCKLVKPHCKKAYYGENGSDFPTRGAPTYLGILRQEAIYDSGVILTIN